MSKPHTLITGVLLCNILHAADPVRTVKVRRAGHPAMRILATEALHLVRAGTFVGKVTLSGRVDQILEVERRIFCAVLEYWDDRAVLRYPTDLRNIPDRVKRREIVDLWERLLAEDPPPRSWSRVS